MGIQISGIQTDVAFGEPSANLHVLKDRVEQEVSAGSSLIIFPECFLSGYCCKSREEAMAFAEPIDGHSVSSVIAACRQYGAFVITGLLERDGDDVFNTAVLAGPNGLVDSYRKVHLPYLGVDRFTEYGNQPFSVCTAGDIRVGMLICYDGGFPEASRSLAVQGADLIALPTNWPPGAENVARYGSNVRAMENGVYFAAVNRVGEERGFRFIGHSRICSPDGTTLDSADHAEEAVLRANIEVSVARTKTLVRVPGQHVIDRMADRRPEMYTQLSEPHSLPRPRDRDTG